MTMALRRILNFVISTQTLQRTVSLQVKKPLLLAICKRLSFVKKVSVGSSFTLLSIWGFASKKDDKETVMTMKKVLITKVDAMYDTGNYKQIYDVLSDYRDSGDVEILWRLCRAMYNMSKTANDADAQKLIYEAYELACIALRINENHYAVHKWMSILLESKSNYEGIKERIRQLYNIKSHMVKATELNPKDATTLYMLGQWCYQIADLSWYQRKLAAVLFGEPPSSSFEEALDYFERAEKIDPKFYSHNLLMLGKTYLRLSQTEKALKYLKLASEFPAKNDDDQIAKQEAVKLLSNI